MNPLLLASSSRYRHQLLTRLQLPFITFSPEIDESPLPGENLKDMAMRLAYEKAKKASHHFPHHICIGSDEIAVLDNQLLGKPETHQNAILQLTAMSGKKVDFYTSLCVLKENQQENYLATSSVKFKNLTPSMIENYLAKEKPYQSAASFKAESLGIALIEYFEGNDLSAIIGLPLIALTAILSKLGVEVL